MIRRLTSALASICLACVAFANDAAVPLTIGDLENAVAKWRRGEEHHLGSIDLSGYSFHWEAGISDGRRAVLLSRLLAGYILVFSKTGVLQATRECGEIVAFQLCDLDEDGLFEIVADEVEARGTGIFTKLFRVYSLRAEQPTLLGELRSFSQFVEYDKHGQAHIRSGRGFVRCDDGGFGRKARLDYFYVEEDASGKQQRKENILELERGELRKGSVP